MNVFQGFSYRKWFLAGLCINILAAIFSAGYHHPDEHFQVLEFANYKLGLAPASELAWEFTEQCRPALQPLIVYLLAKPLIALGWYNPFTLALLLRLLTGIFAWYVTCRLVRSLLPEFETERGKGLFVWCSFFLWFVPYLAVRYSAENISSLFFFLAVTLLLELENVPGQKQWVNIAGSGLLLGFCIFLRLQMGFALLGLGIWMFFSQGWPLRKWVIFLLSGIAAIALSVIADHWLYGVWTFTPYNYFDVNIIQNKAASGFGATPWWDYFYLFLQSAIPPLSIVLLVAFLQGAKKKLFHVAGFTCVFFLAGHFMIGHKEMRFLYPMLLPFIFLCCTGFDKWAQHYKPRKVFNVLISTVIILNIVVLLLRIFIPAQETIAYYRFIYRHAQRQPTVLAAVGHSPYNTVGLEANYYKPRQLPIGIIRQPEQLAGITNEANGKQVLFLDYDLDPSELEGYHYERVFCLFPDWILKFNVNDWQRRSNIWAIYKIN